MEHLSVRGKEINILLRMMSHEKLVKTHRLGRRDQSRGCSVDANITKATELLKVINSQGEGPYAVLTCLGWTVNGPLGRTAPADEHG